SGGGCGGVGCGGGGGGGKRGGKRWSGGGESASYPPVRAICRAWRAVPRSSRETVGFAPDLPDLPDLLRAERVITSERCGRAHGGAIGQVTGRARTSAAIRRRLLSGVSCRVEPAYVHRQPFHPGDDERADQQQRADDHEGDDAGAAAGVDDPGCRGGEQASPTTPSSNVALRRIMRHLRGSPANATRQHAGKTAAVCGQPVNGSAAS